MLKQHNIHPYVLLMGLPDNSPFQPAPDTVRNVTLSTTLSYYAPGTNITCTAKGHPPPSFKWQVQDLEKEGTWMDIHNGNSSEFSVSNGGYRRYRCVAMNVLRGKSYNVTSYEFQTDITGALQSQMEGPQNTLSIVGSDVTLKCSTPFGNCRYVDWLKSIPRANPESVFSVRNGILSPYRDRYSISNSSGCDLVINDVKMMDAGRFTCRVFISPNTVEKSAFLIILKTKPKCAINASLDDTMQGDEVQLTCEVIYNGTDKALMLWRDVKDAAATVANGNTISQFHSVVASAPEVPAFTCVTSIEVKDLYNNGTKIIGMASNTPDISCGTSAIKVLYSVRNVTLSPSSSYYAPGSIITCTAKGNPLPSFKWQVLESENGGTWTYIPNQNSSEFSVSSVISRRYRCVAMNVVRGKRYSATSDEFQVNNADELSSTSASSSEDQIGVGIGIGFGIGLLAAILLAPIAYASLIKLGCLEFHWRQANQAYDDVAQPKKQEKTPSSHQLSSIPSKETASDGQQESVYASLGNDRDTNEYESLELRQKVEPKRNSKP